MTRKKSNIAKIIFMIMFVASCQQVLPEDSNESNITISSIYEIDSNVKNANDYDISTLYGQWEIVSETGTGYIFSETDIKEELGDLIIISEKEFQYDGKNYNKTILNPKYNIKTIPSDEFIRRRNSNFKSFGFQNDEVICIETIETMQDGETEIQFCLFIKDDTTLIMEEALFYELIRKE